MKVFRPVKISEFQGERSPEIREAKAEAKAKSHGKGRPPKPTLSAGEIRARVDAHREKSAPTGAHNLMAKRAEYEKKIEKGEPVEVKTPSDVGLNDPSDPMTSEKLKGVLSSGAINFSEKERDVLSKILGGDA